jgi:hypothetical protein
MNGSVRGILESFTETIVLYLPKLFAGLVLVLIGWALGWFAKRVVVQLCIMLRVERFARRFQWGRDFAKADIRLGIYNAIGNVAFLLVFLVLLNAALDAMQMTALSDVIQRGVLFIPKLFILLLIIGLGWMISWWVATAVRRGLIKEGVPRASLIARVSKFVLRLFFSAMALAQLDIAREIVTIGFTIILSVVGILTILVIALAGREFIQQSMKQKEKDDDV